MWEVEDDSSEMVCVEAHHDSWQEATRLYATGHVHMQTYGRWLVTLQWPTIYGLSCLSAHNLPMIRIRLLGKEELAELKELWAE